MAPFRQGRSRSRMEYGMDKGLVEQVVTAAASVVASGTISANGPVR